MLPCWELGIGIVPYSPLGRGFFGGSAVVESLPACRFSAFHPRFHGGNLDKNKSTYTRIEDMAKKHQCTPAQLALAWVLQQGDDVILCSLYSISFIIPALFLLYICFEFLSEQLRLRTWIRI